MTWVLWALASLVTLAVAPVGYLVTHHAYHRLVGVASGLGRFTRAAFAVGPHLGLIAGCLALASAIVLVRKPEAGRAAVFAQTIAFLGVCVLVAYGLLAPFDLMCDHPNGLFP